MAKTIKQRDLNLLLAMNRDKGGGSGFRLRTLLIPAAILLVLVALGATYFLRLNALMDQRQAARDYLNSPATKSAYEKSASLQQESANMVAQATEVGDIVAGLDSYPDMSSGDFIKIFSLAGDAVNLSGFSYERYTGTLTFNADCRSATRVPAFVAKLRMSGIFSDVSYSGYSGGSYVTNGTPSVNGLTGEVAPSYVTGTSYHFNVRCFVKSPLSEDAGSQAEDARLQAEDAELQAENADDRKADGEGEKKAGNTQNG
jgi:hypothetical protein